MPLRLPPLSSLRFFEAAGRHQSFKRAAVELNVEPSAISHGIVGLELALGVQLFVREPRELTLTPAGADYLPCISEAFSLIANGTQRLPSKRENRTVAVSCAPTLAAINYAGYLGGALIASLISDLVLKDRLYRIGLILAIVPAWIWLPPPDSAKFAKSGEKLEDSAPGALFIGILMAAYFCAGIGYVVSATFIVAITNHLPGLQGQGNWVFLAIGIGATPACIVWDHIARRTGNLNALILSSLLQIVGPAVTGWLAKYSGNYEAGLYLAAGALLIGTVLLFVLKAIEGRAAHRQVTRASPVVIAR